jgi:hypothetical protein
MLIACVLLVNLSLSQMTSSPLPHMKMLSFKTPNFASTMEMNDDSKFLLVRTKLNLSECQLILYYEFDQEGLVEVSHASEDQKLFSSLKYVAPGSPMPLLIRKISSTLKKEQVFYNLCREGTWKEIRGLEKILKIWNIVDWDEGYMQRWNKGLTKTKFLKLDAPQKVDLSNFNLSLMNQEIFPEHSPKMNFTLPVIDKQELSTKIITTIKLTLNECFKTMYKLNSLTTERSEILNQPTTEPSFMDKMMPYISSFFGFGSFPTTNTQVKKIDLINLKIDMDHVLGLMENELLTREDLYVKSERILEKHEKEFMPMIKNQLFVLSQMAWKMKDMDPFQEFNHLMNNETIELMKSLQEPGMTQEKFQIRFAEVFIIYYTQIVTDFDLMGKKSPYIEFINMYMTDIFSRMKKEMDGLMGLVTQDKVRLMSKVQSSLVKTYNYLKSNEPILLPVYPELIQSAEVVGAEFFNWYQRTSDEERRKVLFAFQPLKPNGVGQRKVSRVGFVPFVLGKFKTNELL